MNIPGPILVLDDDPDDHEIIRMVCSKLQVNTSIHFFQEPSQLTDFLQNSDELPFIILCDINMPGVNGLEVREKICKNINLRGRSVPFIFFCTVASKLQVEKAFDLNAHGFFLKGQNLEETEKKLKVILEYWLKSKTPNGVKN